MVKHTGTQRTKGGVGAARLENISYASHISRLYNLLRRSAADDPNPTISGETVRRACQLNGINKPTREVVCNVLNSAGRIDVAKSGAVSVLGTITTAVLETTADIFDDAGPSNDEEAVLELSEKVAERPRRMISRNVAGPLKTIQSTMRRRCWPP